jgi:hypothetical protein
MAVANQPEAGGRTDVAGNTAHVAAPALKREVCAPYSHSMVNGFEFAL